MEQYCTIHPPFEYKLCRLSFIFETGFSQEDIEVVQDIKAWMLTNLSVNMDVKDTKNSLSMNVSENYTVSTMLIMEGADYDEDSEGIWLSDRYAKENKIAVGDTLTVTYSGIEIGGEVAGLVKSGEMMICVADENQLMPDYETFGFAYISPKKLEDSLGMAFYPQINVRSDMEKAELKRQ